MKNNSLKITILSMSLLTIMAGAAASPALGAIGQYFTDVDPILIKMIITLPALFILLTSFVFRFLTEYISSKGLALIGATLYVIGGCGGAFADNIISLLIFRALLGIGVGFLMPLSTGLLGFYFDKKDQTRLMGYSSAMNNLGGIIASVAVGLLVAMSWRYAFAVYLLGIVVFVLVLFFLPREKAQKDNGKISKSELFQLLPYMGLMFVAMTVFYTFPSNFALAVTKAQVLAPGSIGLVMAGQGFIAFITGFFLTKIVRFFKNITKIIATLAFVFGYITLSFLTIPSIIIGLTFIGFGMGLIIPIINSQIPLIIPKMKLTAAMSFISIALFLGQFLSPIIIDDILSLLPQGTPGSPFMVSSIIGIFLTVLIMIVPIRLGGD